VPIRHGSVNGRPSFASAFGSRCRAACGRRAGGPRYLVGTGWRTAVPHWFVASLFSFQPDR